MVDESNASHTSLEVGKNKYVFPIAGSIDQPTSIGVFFGLYPNIPALERRLKTSQNPGDMIMKTSSSNSSFRNAFLMFSW